VQTKRCSVACPRMISKCPLTNYFLGVSTLFRPATFAEPLHQQAPPSAGPVLSPHGCVRTLATRLCSYRNPRLVLWRARWGVASASTALGGAWPPSRTRFWGSARTPRSRRSPSCCRLARAPPPNDIPRLRTPPFSLAAPSSALRWTRAQSLGHPAALRTPPPPRPPLPLAAGQATPLGWGYACTGPWLSLPGRTVAVGRAEHARTGCELICSVN